MRHDAVFGMRTRYSLAKAATQRLCPHIEDSVATVRLALGRSDFPREEGPIGSR